jgi:hypothetical protein
MRVLVAFGDEYRAYREVIAAGIRMLRPQVEVATATPAELEGELEGLLAIVDETEELVG